MHEILPQRMLCGELVKASEEDGKIRWGTVSINKTVSTQFLADAATCSLVSPLSAQALNVCKHAKASLGQAYPSSGHT